MSNPTDIPDHSTEGAAAAATAAASNALKAFVPDAVAPADEPLDTNGLHNGGTLDDTGAVPKKMAPASEDGDVDEEVDADMVSEEVVDEEENLFHTLEEETKVKAMQEMVDQPKAVEAAPRLLQTALKEGQVKADDSEEESDKERETKAADSSPDKPASSEHHVHKRVSSPSAIAFANLRACNDCFSPYGFAHSCRL
jgi:hypothetical protein